MYIWLVWDDNGIILVYVQVNIECNHMLIVNEKYSDIVYKHYIVT